MVWALRILGTLWMEWVVWEEWVERERRTGWGRRGATVVLPILGFDLAILGRRPQRLPARRPPLPTLHRATDGVRGESFRADL